MREMREVEEVARIAKPFAHRAPGGPCLASARTRRAALTVDAPLARRRVRHAGNTRDARMIAWIADHARRRAKALHAGFEPIAAVRARHPATDSRTGVR
ncbi:hypothetical protein [Burkholderia sp. Ed8]|uniref:hypothetical protein n=1 Tax=Burkholderia sp. Ed8 TaxID=3112957 RepID=UPI00345D28FE